ncbi:hypothetical protein BFP72_09840 [Reichenbachiella sp. 5M10]|uniref:Dph6-related ATP pyrophosphatase n=1 Tax=Reichenbachiella sp. 5M10 TaxID=1889772 RepID=UPI000C14E201|nr:ATP-binding protein [Reichenbachiella sp. 5M10]PIB35671.1 hypothetical protein BFP72_09840 [Reichenbachiella sp. 5M10]
MKKTRISVSWSGGKDSAYMLYRLLADPEYMVVELHTALSVQTHRVSMHGVSKDLIQAQADALGLPLVFLSIPADQTNASYEKVLAKYYHSLKKKNIYHIASGDLFLQDLKIYRDNLFANHDMIGVYPLWQENTSQMILDVLNLGFKTVLCCTKQELFPRSLCGHVLTHDLIENLPDTVDPCGENGEYHSFVFDGPIFQNTISYQVHEITNHTYEYTVDDQTQTTHFEFADLRLVL